MVNYGVLITAVMWLMALLIPDHPHHDAGKAFFFIIGAASFCIAVIFELVRIAGS